MMTRESDVPPPAPSAGELAAFSVAPGRGGSPRGAARREEPRFPLLILDVAADQTDEAAADLFALGATGVEERDDQTLARGPGSGRVTLVGSFADRAAAEMAAASIDATFSPRLAEVLGDEWLDAWKQYFVPFHLTPRVTICPPWDLYQPSDAHEIVLQLEPGRAFGTGLHPTTALVARALETRAARLAAAHVLDVGTGSGILALVAHKLGAAKVRAIDVDPEAIEVARGNFRRNEGAANIAADSTPIGSIDGVYDVVTANIEAKVLIAMADDFSLRVRPGGLLVLSGILAAQGSEVGAAFRNWTLEETPAEGEWVALVLGRTTR